MANALDPFRQFVYYEMRYGDNVLHPKRIEKISFLANRNLEEEINNLRKADNIFR